MSASTRGFAITSPSPNIGRPPYWPYRIAVELMYGQHDDLHRALGVGWMVQISTTKFCQRLGIRPGRLRESLKTLQRLGVLRRFNWEGRRAVAHFATPAEWEDT